MGEQTDTTRNNRLTPQKVMNHDTEDHWGKKWVERERGHLKKIYWCMGYMQSPGDTGALHCGPNYTLQQQWAITTSSLWAFQKHLTPCRPTCLRSWQESAMANYLCASAYSWSITLQCEWRISIVYLVIVAVKDKITASMTISKTVKILSHSIMHHCALNGSVVQSEFPWLYFMY